METKYITRQLSSFKRMDGWIKEAMLDKAVVYAEKLENAAGEIKLLNYSNMDKALG